MQGLPAGAPEKRHPGWFRAKKLNTKHTKTTKKGIGAAQPRLFFFVVLVCFVFNILPSAGGPPIAKMRYLGSYKKKNQKIFAPRTSRLPAMPGEFPVAPTQKSVALQAKPDKIPRRKPAFRPDGTITPANSFAISDGAPAAVSGLVTRNVPFADLVAEEDTLSADEESAAF